MFVAKSVYRMHLLSLYPLDPINEADLFALYLVFLSEIQQQLYRCIQERERERERERTITVCMHTAQNRTPTQQWILGLREHSAAHPNDCAVSRVVDQPNVRTL